MKQGHFAGIGIAQPRKPKRRPMSLEQMTAVVPWNRFEQLIVPHYPVAGPGRHPYAMRAMLKIHFMQQWFGLYDPAIEKRFEKRRCCEILPVSVSTSGAFPMRQRS